MPTALPYRGPSAAAELKRRMTRPQRHRLLHGFPLAAGMPSADHIDPTHELNFDPSRKRELIVGVLPHPFCNPAVSGCGFCTFPHEPGNAAKTTPVVKAVTKEIGDIGFRQLNSLLERPVAAVYFGGGTANLCEPDPFAELADLLGCFDSAKAEVTLEGVPAYFLKGNPRLMEVLQAKLPARQYRISFGLQTFDEARLKAMGRAAFGTADTFREVVEYGHSLGYAVSADLLFNLPGQTRDEMLTDVKKAIDLGLDHLGLYHLVMFPGLGTPWSEDRDLLQELPDNAKACDNWLSLREYLLANGWEQTSLTNFEPKRRYRTPERFVYEEFSFSPDRYEAIGFGPSASSYAATGDFRGAVKTLNPTTADAYVKRVEAEQRVWDRAFMYQLEDQKVFWLIRRLAALGIHRGEYRRLFANDVTADFPDVIAACAEAGLLQVSDEWVLPSPTGMFYSDSIAALFARHRATVQAGGRPLPAELEWGRKKLDNAHGHM